jgi:hypothetical protein
MLAALTALSLHAGWKSATGEKKRDCSLRLKKLEKYLRSTAVVKSSPERSRNIKEQT